MFSNGSGGNDESEYPTRTFAINQTEPINFTKKPIESLS